MNTPVIDRYLETLYLIGWKHYRLMNTVTISLKKGLLKFICDIGIKKWIAFEAESIVLLYKEYKKS